MCERRIALGSNSSSNCVLVACVDAAAWRNVQGGHGIRRAPQSYTAHSACHGAASRRTARRSVRARFFGRAESVSCLSGAAACWLQHWCCQSRVARERRRRGVGASAAAGAAGRGAHTAPHGRRPSAARVAGRDGNVCVVSESVYTMRYVTQLTNARQHATMHTVKVVMQAHVHAGPGGENEQRPYQEPCAALMPCLDRRRPARRRHY